MDKKLVGAIEIIKAECKHHRMCEDCVLWSGYECVLDSFPCSWDIEYLEGQYGREKEKADK